jgi:Type II site-specific deoxyribonuclease
LTDEITRKQVTKEAKERIARLSEALLQLRSSQLGWIETVVDQLGRPATFWRWESSDVVTPCVLDDFGDTLRIHHCFSAEPFSKDKFEYALERVLNLCGIPAQRVDSRTNPGHDITIGGQRFSLKTQADKGLKPDGIHISKFMELGKGSWGDQESDYVALRDRFFEHMSRYDRIMTLRRLKGSPSATEWQYELVEIPKALLLQARDARLDIMRKSKQRGSVPAYYRVQEPVADYQSSVKSKFSLYFDGGGERKLQIKDLNKSLCQVHAIWSFEVKSTQALKR